MHMQTQPTKLGAYRILSDEITNASNSDLNMPPKTGHPGHPKDHRPKLLCSLLGVYRAPARAIINTETGRDTQIDTDTERNR